MRINSDYVDFSYENLPTEVTTKNKRKRDVVFQEGESSNKKFKEISVLPPLSELQNMTEEELQKYSCFTTEEIEKIFNSIVT